MKSHRLNLGVSRAADRRIRASVERAGRVIRTCDSCGESFALPAEFTGTESEWTCIPCLDKASAQFRETILP